MDRLFLAVPIDEPTRSTLAEQLRRALPDGLPGRVVPPGSWHFTLRFLGDTREEAAATVSEEIRGAALPPAFQLRFDRCGAFPRPARASVLWLGVSSGAAEMTRLAQAAESAARAAGFPPERRPFSPHLTLSRLREPRDLRPLLEGIPPLDATMEVREIALYRSHLGRGPARYEAVQRFPLG